jgi:methionyl aminopeptidase
LTRLKSEAEISGIRESARILSETLRLVVENVEPRITTAELDRIARSHIEACGARPAFRGYLDYPATLCVSINEEVIHGIPGRRRLADGDIVGIDCGVDCAGCFSDAALTVPVGSVAPRTASLLEATRECLTLAVAAAVPGNRVRDVANAVYRYASAKGYGVVRQFCGHGVGFSPHEDPQVSNYPSSGSNPRIMPGMVLAIEPMITEGTWEVEVLDDGWTVVTADRKRAAHFEHTVAVLRDRAEVLTTHL